MAENQIGSSTSTGKSTGPGQPPGDISVEKRMLLALILMGAVLIGSQYLFRLLGPPPEEAPAVTTEQTAGQTDRREEQSTTPEQRAESPQGGVAQPTANLEGPPDAASERIAAEQEEPIVIETDLIKAIFTNRGAVVTSWTLKDHKDTDGNPLELVNQAAFERAEHPFGLILTGQKAPFDPNEVLFAVTPGEDGLSVDFEYSDGTWIVRKQFRVQPDSYRAAVRSEVRKGSDAVPHLLEWRGGFGDSSVDKRQDFQSVAFFDNARGKLETRVAKDASDGPLPIPGVYAFAGLQDKYFAAMFLPLGRGTIEMEVFSDVVPYNGDDEEASYVGIGIGGAGVNEFDLFLGPKSIDVLKGIHPKLKDLVDFGWFFFIAEPLFFALRWLADNHLHNFGWAIVVLTIGINFVMLPLKITSMKSMKKMQALQPQIQAINERYKGISLRDPRKQQQNQEVMELYQKNGVNPAAGCVPMLLQIPFFFAFYQVLSVAIELRGASWFWVEDLSRPETFAIRFLPLMMVVSQIFMQRLTPTPSTDPTQKMLMNTMPLVFGVIFWWASSGLVLYWLTSNLVGIIQQLFINKFSNNTPLVPVVADKKSAKRKR
jgi:YidC/Oxa1 family membrane protein insertase